MQGRLKCISNYFTTPYVLRGDLNISRLGMRWMRFESVIFKFEMKPVFR
ncbi:hypothetical protein IMCC3135_09925 [Granulosicoccus antarcticus IMCC3135]|uniref:Uncharacterized protein n=1 Tax=Granulosicoccus antarcticus IMCC3135 TaxID=1192854 RepID=A0A2Z2NLN8_9GAMM|nr:hypothetical protein IMCC3135_09925 [Granulosicoccus antarcticus IMCC3135]